MEEDLGWFDSILIEQNLAKTKTAVSFIKTKPITLADLFEMYVLNVTGVSAWVEYVKFSDSESEQNTLKSYSMPVVLERSANSQCYYIVTEHGKWRRVPGEAITTTSDYRQVDKFIYRVGECREVLRLWHATPKEIEIIDL